MSDVNVAPGIDKPQKRKMSILLGLGILLFPIIFTWFTLREGYSTLTRVVSMIWLILNLAGAFILALLTSVTSQGYSNGEIPTVIKIRADQLFYVYQTDEVASDIRLKNEILKVSGTVQSIERNSTNGTDIHFNVGEKNGSGSVVASGGADFSNVAASLSKGQQITVRCRGAGKVNDVPLLLKCKVIEK
jgi:hypothetical protein